MSQNPYTVFSHFIVSRLGWISLVALLVLISLETETGEGREGSVAWRDLLSAVAMQEPRLRQQIAVDSFRHSLITAVLNLYTKKLARESEPNLHVIESSENETSDSDGTSRVRALRVLSTSSDHVVPSGSCPPSPAASLGLHSPLPSGLPSCLSTGLLSVCPSTCHLHTVQATD